jgi:hypothetical protein
MRLHAADDYAAIRTRLEELRLERGRLLGVGGSRAEPDPGERPGLLPQILRAMAHADDPERGDGLPHGAPPASWGGPRVELPTGYRGSLPNA